LKAKIYLYINIFLI